MGAYYALLATVGLVVIVMLMLMIQIDAEDRRNNRKH